MWTWTCCWRLIGTSNQKQKLPELRFSWCGVLLLCCCCVCFLLYCQGSTRFIWIFFFFKSTESWDFCNISLLSAWATLFKTFVLPVHVFPDSILYGLIHVTVLAQKHYSYSNTHQFQTVLTCNVYIKCLDCRSPPPPPPPPGVWCHLFALQK